MDIQNQGGLLTLIMPVVRIVITLVIGAMGGFLFGMIGSMTYPGIGAILGALGGFIVFSLIGCCVIGAWKDCLPEPGDIDLTAAVPKNMQAALFAHGDFTLILTVHRVENFGSAGGFLPFSKPDYYAAVFCGRNPPKSTCTKGNLIWNEQFKMNVTAKDRDITIKLLDQDIFKSEEIGYVSLEIDQDIIQKGFPQEEAHKLELIGAKATRGKKQPQFILSFDFTDDYPRSGINAQVSNAKKQRADKSQKDWNTKYGSFDDMTTLQFNTNRDATRAIRKEYQEKATAEQLRAEAEAHGARTKTTAAPTATATAGTNLEEGVVMARAA